MGSSTHESLDAENVRNVDMSSGVERRRSVSLRNFAREFRFMLSASVQGSIYRKLVFSDNEVFDQGCSLFGVDVRSHAEDGSLLERQLETAENGGLQTVRLQGRHYDYTISRPITCAGTFDDQIHPILSKMTTFGLTVNWPR